MTTGHSRRCSSIWPRPQRASRAGAGATAATATTGTATWTRRAAQIRMAVMPSFSSPTKARHRSGGTKDSTRRTTSGPAFSAAATTMGGPRSSTRSRRTRLTLPKAGTRMRSWTTSEPWWCTTRARTRTASCSMVSPCTARCTTWAGPLQRRRVCATSSSSRACAPSSTSTAPAALGQVHACCCTRRARSRTQAASAMKRCCSGAGELPHPVPILENSSFLSGATSRISAGAEGGRTASTAAALPPARLPSAGAQCSRLTSAMVASALGRSAGWRELGAFGSCQWKRLAGKATRQRLLPSLDQSQPALRSTASRTSPMLLFPCSDAAWGIPASASSTLRCTMIDTTLLTERSQRKPCTRSRGMTTCGNA
mmetsp:Transcript_5754/g.19091  ORF Transcript_5754/g.19091 Transcript_5754/m.19091 type:complete len:369 (+) Transcript_5754:435-1541(+)